MRRISLSIALLLLAVAPARAQRVQDFGFGAGFSMHPKSDVSPQLSATMTLGIRGHDVELAAGSTSADAFFSVTRIWTNSYLSYGAGVAVYNDTDGTVPGFAANGAFAVPLAPRSAAAFQIVGRAIAASGGIKGSLSAGIKLAPLRGGLLLGERVPQPREQEDVRRSWDVMVAQIMLLNNGSSTIEEVEVTDVSITMRFAQAARTDVMEDVARVARILSASSEYVQVIIRAPEAVWMRAAVTSGGFPAERITEGYKSNVTIIQALRAPRESSDRSGQP